MTKATKTTTLTMVLVALIIAMIPTTASATTKMTVSKVAKQNIDPEDEWYVGPTFPVTGGKNHTIVPDVSRSFEFSKVVTTKKGRLYLVWEFEDEIKSSEITGCIESGEMYEVFIEQNTKKGIKEWLVIYDESQGMTPWYVEAEDGTVYEAEKVGKYCWKLTEEE